MDENVQDAIGDAQDAIDNTLDFTEVPELVDTLQDPVEVPQGPVDLSQEPAGNALSAYGHARSSVGGTPLGAEDLARIDAFWRACNYLALGMIYLRDNPLLREPLAPEHLKSRLLGHWGSSPALSFLYTHLNRVIAAYDLNMIFMAGPGHGAPGVLGPVYLEGTYSEVFPDKSLDEEGLRRFF